MTIQDLNASLYAASLAGLLIILQTSLMLTVGLYRGRIGQFVGLGEDPNMERLTRRHGNLAENACLFVCVLALLELLSGQTAIVMWLAIIFAVARILHAIAFSDLAGSHGVSKDGAKRIFVLSRISGAMLIAMTSFTLGGALIYAVLALT